MRVINRFASVPAGCPEPYLYDRLFSGSEIAVGVEAASANSRVTNHPTFSPTIIAKNVRDLKTSRTKQTASACLVAASLQFVEERTELLVIESQRRPRWGGVRRG